MESNHRDLAHRTVSPARLPLFGATLEPAKDGSWFSPLCLALIIPQPGVLFKDFGTALRYITREGLLRRRCHLKGFSVCERSQRKGVGRFHLHARIASVPFDWRPFGVPESSRSGAGLTSAKNHQDLDRTEPFWHCIFA
jgi:hypothetical protein